MLRRLAGTLCVLGLLACGQTAGHSSSMRGDPVIQLAPVGGHVVGTVGGEPLTEEEIVLAARVHGLSSVRAARDLVVQERLLAVAARNRDMLRDPLIVDTYRRAMIQQLLVETVEHDTTRETLSPKDVADGIRIFGFDLSHDTLYRTQHLVVTVPPTATAENRDAARRLAESFRASLTVAPRPIEGDVFMKLAETAMGKTAHKTEILPPIDASGRFARGSMVPEFARAASLLEHPGDLSPVVMTQFGFHVIVLLEKLPPQHLSADEIKIRVEDELLRRVRRMAFDSLLKDLRSKYNTNIPEDVLRVVERIGFDSHGQ